jgi:hypothetical protein
MSGDVVTSALELAAIVLLVLGLAMVAAVLVGGLLGAGVGLVVAGVMAGGASAVLQLVHRDGPS